MSEAVDHMGLYRLPWNLCDNGISWLEPTAQCNLVCDGCYRRNRVEHKSFEDTLNELDVFDKNRKSDSISIAGGDPLLYPHLLRTIEESAKRGYKPVINTNGAALTHSLLRELSDAGLYGFTFHIDSKQGRKGQWKDNNELELCALRDELADMADSIDASCAFNATVYPDTLQYVPKLTKWAESKLDKVHVMVFILYRDMITRKYRFFDGINEVETVDEPTEIKTPKKRAKKERNEAVYNFDVEKTYKNYVKADDVIAKIRESDPRYMPSAFLNGTQDPTSFKWLLSGRIGRPNNVYGWVGPKFQELAQVSNHLIHGKYLAYASKATTKHAKRLLPLAAIDGGMKNIARGFLKDSLRHPISAITKPLFFQSLLVIQPIDMMADGMMNMCDGCPDITVWDGKLVWSCRMDEQEKYGRNLWAMPREDGDDAKVAEEPKPTKKSKSKAKPKKKSKASAA